MLYYVMLRYVILLLCFLYEHSSAVTTGLRFVTGSKFVCCRVWESRSVVQGTGLHLGVIETEAWRLSLRSSGESTYLHTFYIIFDYLQPIIRDTHPNCRRYNDVNAVSYFTSRRETSNVCTSLLLSLTLAYLGGGSGVQPPPRNSEGPPNNRAKLNPIVKTVKKNCWI